MFLKMSLVSCPIVCTIQNMRLVLFSWNNPQTCDPDLSGQLPSGDVGPDLAFGSFPDYEPVCFAHRKMATTKPHNQGLETSHAHGPRSGTLAPKMAELFGGSKRTECLSSIRPG